MFARVWRLALVALVFLSAFVADAHVSSAAPAPASARPAALLHLGLVCSDTVATRVRRRESGLWSGDFLARMNAKPQQRGLKGPRFVESTALDHNNVSTASDVARMLQTAASDPLIHSIT